MKKIVTILGAAILVFMVSCEGPRGFDGADGTNGSDGETAQVFEVEEVNFTYLDEANSYSSILAFEDFTSFDIINEDAIFVYRFDGTTEFQDGTVENLWSLIPQSFFLTEGTIQYTNSHTSRDVEIFIDGDFDLATLNTDFTQDQIFRIVMVPGQSALTSKTDKSNIASLMSSLGLGEKDVKKVKLQ